MNHLYTFLALDLADERARDAAEIRRAVELVLDRPADRTLVRRGLAAGLAVVSRAAAVPLAGSTTSPPRSTTGGSPPLARLPAMTGPSTLGDQRGVVGPPDASTCSRWMRTQASSTVSSCPGPGASPSRSAARSPGHPAATAWGVDELQVFAVFTDGQLWNRYWDGVSWHDWEPMGGELVGPAGGIVVGRRPDRRVRRGRDGLVWHRWWDGTRWVEWEQLPA